MDATLQAVGAFVGTVGFPIAMCIILVWMIVTQNKRHAEESSKWVEALNNNTKAINDFISVVRKP